MGIIDRVRAAFTAGPAADADVYERAVSAPLSGGSTSLYSNQAGARKGSDDVLALYRDSPRLRAVAHKVGSAVASAEWRIYARRDPLSTKEDPRYLMADDLSTLSLGERKPALHRAVAEGDVDEITSHPALRLINRPNRSMSGFSARLVTQVHLDLVGDAFWVIDENDAGMPIRAWPIPPTWVTRTPTEAQPSFQVSFGGFAGVVPAEHMIWFKDVDPAEPYGRGSGIGLALADELDIDEHAGKTVASWFQNSGMPSMIVSLKGASQATTERARSRWDRTLKGFRRAYQTYFTGSDIAVQRLDTSFKDMALVDIRKDVRDAVNQTYGVPPEKLGIIENSNRATSEAAEVIFIKDVVIPRLELMRQELQWKLITRYDPRLIIDFVSPLPEDRETRNSVATAMPFMFSIDEHRARAGMPPLLDDDGVGYMVGNPPRWVRNLRDLEQKTSNAPIYGYHLGSGAITNNELRASLGLPPVAEAWGSARTVNSHSPAELPAPAASEAAPGTLLLPSGPTGAPPVANDPLTGFSPVAEDIEAERSRQKTAQRKAWVTIKQTRSVVDCVDEAVLVRLVAPVLAELVTDWGNAVADLASKVAPAVDAMPAVTAFLAGLPASRLAPINETTKAQLKARMETWDGDDDAALMRSVRDVFDTARCVRCPLICTCEAQHAGQTAARMMMREGAPVEMKEWLAVMDGRTREAHRELDGQRVGVNDDYTVPGGEWAGRKAQGPGQFGEGALDINCRCFSVPFFEEATDEDRAASWGREDARLRKWEARLSDAVTEAFDEQERVVLERLRVILETAS